MSEKGDIIRVNGRFAPGTSGNPSGRPKETGEVRELARQHTDKAIATLADIMEDAKQPPAARVAAASALLDRGYGKAPQSMEIDARYAFPGEEMVLVTRAVPPPPHWRAARMGEEHDD